MKLYRFLQFWKVHSQIKLYRVTTINVSRKWIEWAEWAASLCMANSPFPGHASPGTWMSWTGRALPWVSLTLRILLTTCFPCIKAWANVLVATKLLLSCSVSFFGTSPKGCSFFIVWETQLKYLKKMKTCWSRYFIKESTANKYRHWVVIVINNTSSFRHSLLSNCAALNGDVTLSSI